MMGFKKRLSALFAGLLLLAGASVLSAPAASAAVSGTVTCFYGNNAEVGIWVNAGSKSGWASRSPNGSGGVNYSYGAISAGTTYRLHVGCGGTPQNWGTTFYTPWVTGGYYDWVCTSRYGCYQS
jgi:hypothetical protein